MDIVNIADINYIVTAAVCLHNNCIRKGDHGEDFAEAFNFDDYGPNRT